MLHQYSLQSNERLVIIKNQAELETYLERRASSSSSSSSSTTSSSTSTVTAGLLSVDGAHALQGKLSNLDHLFDKGVRMMSLVNIFDNEVGGSVHGECVDVVFQ